MATSTGFKQQCPSCEAMVPIRDTKLVGKKIDCPKCKYRFVVEEPAPEEEEEAPARSGKKTDAGKGKAAAKAEKGDKEKKEGSNKTLGIVLVVVALALLGAGGYFIFIAGGSDEQKPAAPGGKIGRAHV